MAVWGGWTEADYGETSFHQTVAAAAASAVALSAAMAG